MNFRKYFSTRATPQSQPIPGSAQEPNNAGGYAWAIDDWKRLDRFLVLGSEGGTYYVGEATLTRDNAQAVLRCIQGDGVRVVGRIVEVSEAARAPKNDPALFALAMAVGLGDADTRRAALEALPRVARIGTHLFHFFDYVEGFRGWGRGLRRAVAAWYNGQEAGELAYDLIKYRQRDGWSHRDALRLAHPKVADEGRNRLYKWVVDGWQEGWASDGGPLELIWAFEQAQSCQDEGALCGLIREHSLPREALPTRWLKRPAVWEALLERMPMTAMMRNLGNMGSCSLLVPGSAAAAVVTGRLGDGERLRKARVHPIQVLSALLTYQQGHGVRGSNKWEAVPQIVDALDAAFYRAFGNVEPTGKRILLALDVSGSMAAGSIAGVPGLTPRIGSAAMALVTAGVERHHHIVAFSQAPGYSIDYSNFRQQGPHTMLQPVAISPRQRLDDVVGRVSAIPMGGTDCALPMLWALAAKAKFDAFVVYTDSETWAGAIHPAQALVQYRQKTGIPATLVVVGMTATEFSIADPDDAGMLDVVGFDTATPQLISDFVAGR